MNARVLSLSAVAALLVAALPVEAHHSFAVHFVGDQLVTVRGTVTDFSFSNPHGVVRLAVTAADGSEQQWKVETNSPNILRRRGWTASSLKKGDAVTIEGYPARDGSHMMRVARIVFADGHELVGQRPDPNVVGGDD